MAASSVLARVAPPSEIIGLGRKEAIYDSDAEPEGAPLGNMQFFVDFQNFSRAALVPFTKANGEGVFTNLFGSGTGAPLPAGYKFGGYRSRLSFHSYDEDPTIIQNLAYWADCRLARSMGYVTIKTDQADYMTMRGRDLVSWEDNERLALSQGAGGELLCLPTPGTDHEGRALDVGSQPLVLEALQSWRTKYVVPVARTTVPNFSPIITLIATKTFDGVLVRPTG